MSFPWAVVTGASSGLGEALARELAARGYALLLLGRNAARLRALKESLSTLHGCPCQIIAVDLSMMRGIDAVIESMERLDGPVDVLVNNAGFAVHGPFSATELRREQDLVQVQIGALLALTKAVLPRMVARGRGRILNVGSVYSHFPVPWQTVYGACKAFLASFSHGLRQELRGSGVTVTLLCPGTTRTPFRSRAGLPDDHGGDDPKRIAELACRALFRGDATLVPGGRNRMYITLARLLPRGAFDALLRRFNERRGLGGAP